MLSKAENERLTRVGPGTPMGELLRRYWQPVGCVSELTAERPKLRVKVMHEELVVFRDAQGSYGCVAEHCPHRGASLYYGFVEDCGIRCPYHGWKYDAAGNCLEQPFEPVGSTYKDRIKQRAYPVQQLGGLLFVYMGPLPAPLLPKWDVLAWEGGQRKFFRWAPLRCNWLQAAENSADIIHTYYLHGHALALQGARGLQAEYFFRPVVQYGYQPYEWGIVKSWTFEGHGSVLGDEVAGGNPLVLPGMVRVLEQPWHSLHFRVPIDDTTTQVYWAGYLASDDPADPAARLGCDPACRACARITAGEPPDPAAPLVHEMPLDTTPEGEYHMRTFYAQDRMAWETAGPCYDRGEEHLGVSDRGILMYRQMLREQLKAVEEGRDPQGTIRDPAQHQLIELPAWVTDFDAEKLRELGAEGPNVSSMAALFDERHESIELDPGVQIASRPY